MANFILVHEDCGTELHKLYWNIPFTAEEIEKIYDLRGDSHGLIEELDFEPYDIPFCVSLAWLTPLGVQNYRRLLNR